MAIVTNTSAGLRAAGHATILQLRAPMSTAREIAEEAVALVAESPVPVLVSSRCDIALAAGAAGVNLPENDIPILDARKLLAERIIGRSVHSLESAKRAESDGADYVIFGPVWASASHPGHEPAGLAALARVAGSLRIPVIAIGGITEQRIAACRDAGSAGFAAIRYYDITPTKSSISP